MDFEKLESINDSDNVPLEVFHWEILKLKATEFRRT